MLTELGGKGGCLCQPAKEGRLRCPLIVRPTSEDVITGQLFLVLRVLNPHWWVADLLNEALGASRFRRQCYRRFQIELWKNRPYYPRELLPWDEGSTQVDATLTWENPPTTVFFEMKYGSDLSPRTAQGDRKYGYPSDQLIRNARVGLLECGYFQLDRLFHPRPRDFALVLVGPDKGHPLVTKYRNPAKLKAKIPHSDRLPQLPRLPFIGELSYADIVRVLKRQRRWFSRPERSLLDTLIDYLEHKRAHVPPKFWSEQRHLRFDRGPDVEPGT